MNIPSFVTLLILGIVICVIGGINYSGNISTLHEYHRSRVKEEDIKPFGKMIGIGTLIIGISLLVYAVMLLLTALTANYVFTYVGVVIMLVCIVVGVVISFRAMIKYNGGIF